SSLVVAQQQLVEAGAWAARATAAGRPAYAYKTLPSAYTNLHYRIFFDLVSNKTTVVLVRFRTATASVLMTLGVNNSSKLFTNDQITGKTATGPSVAKGMWHELQVHVLVNGTSSREDVWLDGSVVSALSRSDSLGTSPVGRVDIGDTTSKRTFDVAFDDVAAGTSFIDTAQPTAPASPSVSSFSDQEVDLSWSGSSDNVGVTGYTVYRSDDAGATYSSIGTSSVTNYADKTVSASSTYSYVVDAFDAAGNHSDRSSAVTVSTPEGSTTPIQHVVIIDEENHTFNDVLGKFCVEQASGQIIRAGVNDPCVGTDQGVISGSSTPYPLTSEPDVGLSIGHSPTAQQAAIDGGKMDGFSTINGCTASSSPSYGCLTQYDPMSGPCASSNGSCIPNMTAYATNYAISDATFTSDQTGSWAG